MNRNYNILFGALVLLISGCFLQACQEDDLGGTFPSREELIEQGMYLTARSEDASMLFSDTEEPRLFKAGTPYRLLAFAKPYNRDGDPIARFNKVAWEGATSSGLHYINIDSDPAKWFGFSALEDETGGDDGLMSLDFYGFTYGVEENEHNDNYIPVTGWNGAATSIDDITRTEQVTDGRLNDLMRGELLDQNIATAGVESTDEDGYQNPAFHAQSVMPFHHCFSKLHFQVSQQENEDVLDANGNPTKTFKDLYVDKIEVTNTYQKGTVYLKDGKVQVDTKIDRDLTFKDSFTGEVTLNNSDAGEMIIFPTDGASLRNDMPGGYTVGLNITVRSTVKADIESMLINTGSVSPENVTDAITETHDGGTTWYSGTIKKSEIIDYSDLNNTDTPLYFKHNTAYMLIIVFQDDSVRIITVMPQIEEWLPGEGTSTDPWQNQEMGQPQMFDNIVWSDRNLGSDYHDPTGDHFEEAVGYFYQSGRNIPYYPFQYKLKDATGKQIKPDIRDKNKQDLPNRNSGYRKSDFRFYPIVDNRLLKMTGSNEWTMYRDGTQNPQMMIPESYPTDATFFDFLRGTDSGNSGLRDDQNMHWDAGQHNQPVSGAWVIPSSKDFLTIFPSTPHAGNITFRAGGYNSSPMSWEPAAMDDNIKVLRVTVPYYDTIECDKPWHSNPSAMYTKAWNTLKDNKDPGSTTQGYKIRPGYAGNPDYEPDGDPADGYASVYVISREGDDLVQPDILQKKDINGDNWSIKSWGTIYAIKRIYTSEAYRMRWRVMNASKSAVNPCFYVEICRYRCQPDSKLTVENYKDYDWEHPAAKLYFPICGLGDWTGEYINFGTECQYATSDRILDGKTSSVQIKVSGNDAYNAYIAVVTNVINRNFGLQIRPIMMRGGVNSYK